MLAVSIVDPGQAFRRFHCFTVYLEIKPGDSSAHNDRRSQESGRQFPACHGMHSHNYTRFRGLGPRRRPAAANYCCIIGTEFEESGAVRKQCHIMLSAILSYHELSLRAQESLSSKVHRQGLCVAETEEAESAVSHQLHMS
jgi:hypothetical protein